MYTLFTYNKLSYDYKRDDSELRKNLNERIKISKKELNSLEGWMINESHFGDVLDNPTAGRFAISY